MKSERVTSGDFAFEKVSSKLQATGLPMNLQQHSPPFTTSKQFSVPQALYQSEAGKLVRLVL